MSKMTSEERAKKYAFMLEQANKSDRVQIRYKEFYLRFEEPELMEANYLLVYDISYIYDFLFVTNTIHEKNDAQIKAILYNAVTNDQDILRLLNTHVLKGVKIRVSIDDEEPTNASVFIKALKFGKPAFLIACLYEFINYIFDLELGDELMTVNAGLARSSIIESLQAYRIESLDIDMDKFRKEWEKLNELSDMAKIVVDSANRTVGKADIL